MGSSLPSVWRHQRGEIFARALRWCVAPNAYRRYRQAQRQLPAVDRVVCGGTWMVSQGMIENEQWDEIAVLVREAVELVS
ncbi:hypothetical protein OK016_27325 [Vibrio chagasii]|nr:hypothetical protein [Vibrio chagasii]